MVNRIQACWNGVSQILFGASRVKFSIILNNDTMNNTTETNEITKAIILKDLPILYVSRTKIKAQINENVIDRMHGNISNSN